MQLYNVLTQAPHNTSAPYSCAHAHGRRENESESESARVRAREVRRYEEA